MPNITLGITGLHENLIEYPLKMVSAIFTVVVFENLIYATEQDLNKR